MSNTMEWMTIDSAPRDGTLVLLMFSNSDPKTGKWREGCGFIRWDKNGLPIMPEGSWESEAGVGYGLLNATYWQPLPNPPKPVTSAQG